MNELTELEDAELSSLEEVISKNINAVVETADAFRIIRDKRLYRDEFTSFEEYCQTKWAKSCRAINLTIEADSIRQNLGTTGSHLTRNAALALKNVKPVSRPKVIKKASKLAAGKPISPSHIAQATSTQQRDYSSAYTSPKQDTDTTPATKPPSTPSDPNPIPPITDTPSAIAAIESCYQRLKPWFNDLPLKTPRQIIDRLISTLQQP